MPQKPHHKKTAICLLMDEAAKWPSAGSLPAGKRDCGPVGVGVVCLGRDGSPHTLVSDEISFWTKIGHVANPTHLFQPVEPRTVSILFPPSLKLQRLTQKTCVCSPLGNMTSNLDIILNLDIVLIQKAHFPHMIAPPSYFPGSTLLKSFKPPPQRRSCWLPKLSTYA